MAAAFLPLLHSPAKVIQQMLIQMWQCGNPEGTPIPQWPAYAGNEPDKPDDVVTVYNTQGTDDGRLMESGELMEHPGVTIRVRTGDEATGEMKALDMAWNLDQVKRREVVVVEGSVSATYLMQNVRRTGGIVPYPLVSSRRRAWNINCLLTLTRTA